MSIIHFVILNLIIVAVIAYVLSKYSARYTSNMIDRRESAPSHIERFSIIFMPAVTNSQYKPTASAGVMGNFFDADIAFCKPDSIEEISNELVVNVNKLLQSHPNAKMAFVEKDSGPVGVITTAGLLSNKTGVPFVIIRPRSDVMAMSVKGYNLKEGDELILVQDVVTTGNQVVLAQNILNKFGSKIIGVVSLLDREEERMEKFIDLDIDTKSILKISEFLSVKEKIELPNNSDHSMVGQA